MVFVQFSIVGFFIAIHVSAGRLVFLEAIPRSRWLSFAGGVSVAYVFMHVFPELREAHLASVRNWQSWLSDHLAYLAALCGIVIFYGLERLVKNRRGSQCAEREADVPPMAVFWLHIGAFAAYNLLLGYLLAHREDQNLTNMLLYGIAIGFHFLVNDFAMRQHHKRAYHDRGRWVLAAAVLVGWIAGLNLPVNELASGVVFAFLAGGIILNVLKEELPEDRQSRFLPFALGAAGYSVLMVFA